MLRPRVARNAMQMMAMAPKIVNDVLADSMNLTAVFCIRFLDIPVVKVRFWSLPLPRKCS